jgi:tetratricopeptide (TPR) repeat protein
MKKLLAKARALYRKHRYKEATVVAKKALSLDRNNEEALFYVAHGFYHAGQFKRSLIFWNRLKKICPKEPNLHLNMGACYDALGNKRFAIQNYKRELALNPNSATALHNLGDIYYFAHKYTVAVVYLEQSHSLKRLPEICIGKLARSYFKTGQARKEQDLYEEFLRTNPKNTWALNNLGSHLMDQGEYYRALILLKKAARLDPNDKLVEKNIRKTLRELNKLKSSTAN